MKRLTREQRVRALSDECGSVAALHEMMSGLAVALGSLVALEVERDDILRGARRCRDGWREALADLQVERSAHAMTRDALAIAREERDAAIARANTAERYAIAAFDELLSRVPLAARWAIAEHIEAMRERSRQW